MAIPSLAEGVLQERDCRIRSSHTMRQRRQRPEDRPAGAEVQRKREVLSELMEEHIKLKKNLGNSDRNVGSPVDP